MSEKHFCPLAKLYRTDYELENGGNWCDAEKCAWGVRRDAKYICALSDMANSFDGLFKITYLRFSGNHETSVRN